MNSKDAMREACAKLGVKHVAATLGVSPSSIYNQINDDEKTDLFSRFVNFIDACESDEPLRWICEEFNGFFVKNPEVLAEKGELLRNYVSNAVKEFGDVLREVGTAMEDQNVTKDEAKVIRKEWEELKRLLESFVLACEYGYVRREEEQNQSPDGE